MDKTITRRRCWLIMAIMAISVSLGSATAQAQDSDTVTLDDAPDFPVLDGGGLTAQRDAAIQEMLKVNPDVELPSTLPPVDPNAITPLPDLDDNLDGEQTEPSAATAATASECKGKTLYEGYRGGIGLFPYRASSYTDMRCAGAILYSCRARVQARLAGEYRTVAIGPLRVQSLGRLCQSSVNSGSFVRDYWRTNNTYTLTRYDSFVWGAPTSLCPIGSGTPVARCYVKKRFRNGQSGTIRIF